MIYKEDLSVTKRWHQKHGQRERPKQRSSKTKRVFRRRNLLFSQSIIARYYFVSRINSRFFLQLLENFNHIFQLKVMSESPISLTRLSQKMTDVLDRTNLSQLEPIASSTQFSQKIAEDRQLKEMDVSIFFWFGFYCFIRGVIFYLHFFSLNCTTTVQSKHCWWSHKGYWCNHGWSTDPKSNNSDWCKFIDFLGTFLF